MNRRKFINNSTLTLSGLLLGNLAFGKISPNIPSLVSVSGGQPEEMYLKGIREFGGIEQFVKKNDRVVIKPNMATNSTPDQHLTTNPELIKRIIEQCYEAGAREVDVFEHTIDPWAKCYKNSGIERVAKDAGCRVLPANEEFYYSEIQKPQASVLRKIKLHNSLLGSDVIINLSVFKPDVETGISGAIKNLMGCTWEKEFYTKFGMETCLAEFLYYINPELNITELYAEVGTPQLIISNDIVAADSYASKLNNTPLNPMNHVLIAEKLGFGKSQLSGLDVKKLSL